ncbi:MAG: lysophospholipid acyltransferase family protein [Candidatus Omnitrophota bacterium]
MFYWIGRFVSVVIVKWFLGLEVIGLENIRELKAFIIASNHCSNLDPMAIGASLKRRVRFFAKKELTQIKYFSWITKRLALILIDRKGFDRAALREALAVLHNGEILAVFPEGTRSVDGKLGEAKAGVSIFAFSAKVPVVPVCVQGTNKALPAGARSIKRHKIRLIFGKPIIPPSDVSRENKKILYENFADRIMREIDLLGKEKD